MRPIKLILSAYGPYADVVEIPFEPFREQGLFLITGDTGAGKTTVFDGITYALFGSVSGSIRTTATLRSDFAKPAADTYAELHFSHKDKLYKIRRSPEYQRLKKKGDGTTTKPAETELHLPGGKVITKQREVDQAVEELLGVNYKQWTQISMIAQGEFQKLLNADSKVRGEIFRKVFHTEGLAWAQAELTRMLSESKKGWESGRQSVLQYVDELLCPEVSCFFEQLQQLKKEGNVHRIEECLTLAEAILEEDGRLEASLSQQCQDMQQELDVFQAQKTMAAHINQLFSEKKKAENQSLVLGQSASAMAELEQTIRLHRKAVFEVEPLEKAWGAELEQWEEIQQQKNVLTKQVQQETVQLEKLIQQEGQAQEKKPMIEVLAAQIAKHRDSLPQYVKAEEKREGVRLAAEKTALGEQQLAAKKELQGRLSEQVKELVRISDSLQSSKLERERVTAQEQQQEEKLLELEKKIKLLERYEQVLEDWKLESAKYERMEMAWKEGDTAYRQQELLYLRSQAGLLALQLREGEPCPVCGALEHPAKALLTGEVSSKEQLDIEKERLEKQLQVLQQKSGQLALWKNTMEELQTQIAEGPQSIADWNVQHALRGIRTAYAACKVACGGLTRKRQKMDRDIKEWEGDLTRLKSEAVELETVDLVIQSMELELRGTQQRYETQRQAYEEFTSQLEFHSKAAAEMAVDSMEKEKAVLEELLRNAVQRAEAQRTRVVQSQAKLEDKQQELPKWEQRTLQRSQEFLKGMKLSGFSDESHYRALRVSQETLQKEEDKLAKYRQMEMELEIKQRQLNEQLKEKKPTDVTELEEGIRLCTEKMDSLDLQLKALSGRMMQNLSIKNKIKKAKMEYNRVEHRYFTMKQLADTANGALPGKQKITFEQYVQAGYFEQVLRRANSRLTLMSNQRYLLKKKEAGFDLRSQNGLDLDVYDAYTGKTRGVKSLSGGETFQASLALALGMSDVMQSSLGGIQLDTLFIDEGFGSLDQDALEQAVRVLYTLTEGNRLIGIISHVSELKDSISQKLVVTASKGSDRGKGSQIRLET